MRVKLAGLRWARCDERSATASAPGAAAEVKRWGRLGEKSKLCCARLGGESVDALSRGLAAPIYRLEQWRDRALAGIDTALKERANDPVEKQRDEANRRIGERAWKSRFCASNGQGDGHPRA